mgnify:CR=1 FL=1
MRLRCPLVNCVSPHSLRQGPFLVAHDVGIYCCSFDSCVTQPTLNKIERDSTLECRYTEAMSQAFRTGVDAAYFCVGHHPLDDKPAFASTPRPEPSRWIFGASP